MKCSASHPSPLQTCRFASL
uniref:Uncharacterized protein n=1 Tax=Arundo donax TaxID=35708 RepID=A0A0A9BR70_ARUDO